MDLVDEGSTRRKLWGESRSSVILLSPVTQYLGLRLEEQGDDDDYGPH